MRRDLSFLALTIVGWFGITYGVARLTTPLVWPISLGLFCLSVIGLRVLAHLAWHGVTTFLPKGRP